MLNKKLPALSSRILEQSYNRARQELAGSTLLFTLLMMLIFLLASQLLQREVAQNLPHLENWRARLEIDIRVIGMINIVVILCVIRVALILLNKNIFMCCSHMVMTGIFIYALVGFNSIDGDILNNIFRAGLGFYVPFVVLSLDILFLYYTLRYYLASSGAQQMDIDRELNLPPK